MNKQIKKNLILKSENFVKISESLSNWSFRHSVCHRVRHRVNREILTFKNLCNLCVTEGCFYIYFCLFQSKSWGLVQLMFLWQNWGPGRLTGYLGWWQFTNDTTSHQTFMLSAFNQGGKQLKFWWKCNSEAVSLSIDEEEV